MKITDILPDYGNEAKCLYCNHQLKLLKYAANSSILEYDCEKCGEGFLIRHHDDIPVSFVFTIYWESKNKQFIVDLKNDQISSNDIKLSWMPYFKLDFSNKEKLYQKLNTYITFS